MLLSVQQHYSRVAQCFASFIYFVIKKIKRVITWISKETHLSQND